MVVSERISFCHEENRIQREARFEQPSAGMKDEEEMEVTQLQLLQS